MVSIVGVLLGGTFQVDLDVWVIDVYIQFALRAATPMAYLILFLGSIGLTTGVMAFFDTFQIRRIRSLRLPYVLVFNSLARCA